MGRLIKKYKYIEHSELYEETLYKRSFNKVMSSEEQVEYNDNILKLKLAIDKLPEKQKRRLKMYYFDDFSLGEIARIEGCSFQAISKSII